MRSTRLRSFIKAITWETSGILTFLVIALVAGGDIWKSLEVGFVYFPVHTAFYFVHERLWKRVKWGHGKPRPAYECPVCRPWTPND